MERKEILEVVKDAIVQVTYASREDISEDRLMSNDLQVDSIDQVEITMYLETELGIHIPDEDMLGFTDMTVGSVVNYLEKKISQKG